ncbi:MAG: GNAT family N-acetyltransferase [Acidobacteria bacterium]|nr:GNAT family N-acetyltransferase [Acidobacteriota bacterium]
MNGVASLSDVDATFLACEATLRDGLTVHLRPLKPVDEAQLLRFFRALSDRSRWLRFFSNLKDPSLIVEAHNEAEVDFVNRFGLLALAQVPPRIVGHAFYYALPNGHADAAFAVADDYQGLGLGTLLLGQLARVAAANGFTVLEADVMAENQKMLEVFRHSGFAVKTKVEAGQIHIEFPIAFPNEALARMPQQGQTLRLE